MLMNSLANTTRIPQIPIMVENRPAWIAAPRSAPAKINWLIVKLHDGYDFRAPEAMSATFASLV